QIVLDGFLHHIFQRNLVLCGDALAIIVFGRIVRHSSVHARNFETHVAPFRCYSYPFASKHLTALIATAHAKSRGLGENNLREPCCIFWFYQNRQQHSGTTLFHLHGNPKYIQRPFLDRKSTRLNSSHVAISYAVFCLKKTNRRPVLGFIEHSI